MSEVPGYPDTFVISENGKSIKCLHCNTTSHNTKDVQYRYCGKCHMFHDDVWPPARQDWIEEGQKGQEDHPDWEHGEPPDRAQLLAWLVIRTNALERIRAIGDHEVVEIANQALTISGPDSRRIAGMD